MITWKKSHNSGGLQGEKESQVKESFTLLLLWWPLTLRRNWTKPASGENSSLAAWSSCHGLLKNRQGRSACGDLLGGYLTIYVKLIPLAKATLFRVLPLTVVAFLTDPVVFRSKE